MTSTNTPVVVGLGQAVHIANGTGTLCTANPRGAVSTVAGTPVTCKRCLKAAEATPATDTPEPIANLKEGKRSGKGTPTACACGCGEATSGGRYRPGHDARHAGILARQVVAGQQSYAVAMEQLATPALQAKATRQIERAEAKSA